MEHTHLGWVWWLFGIFAAAFGWVMFFRDPNRQRGRLFGGFIAIIYTIGLLAGVIQTFIGR